MERERSGKGGNVKGERARGRGREVTGDRKRSPPLRIISSSDVEFIVIVVLSHSSQRSSLQCIRSDRWSEVEAGVGDLWARAIHTGRSSIETMLPRGSCIFNAPPRVDSPPGQFSNCLFESDQLLTGHLKCMRLFTSSPVVSRCPNIRLSAAKERAGNSMPHVEQLQLSLGDRQGPQVWRLGKLHANWPRNPQKHVSRVGHQRMNGLRYESSLIVEIVSCPRGNVEDPRLASFLHRARN